MWLDIFNNSAFSVTSLTGVINELPYIPGRVSRMGLFTESGVATTTIAIEQKKGVLSLIKTTPRGGPAVQNTSEKRTVRSLAIPHIAVEDTVNADEVQGVRAFGTESQLEGVQSVVNARLNRMNTNVDVTLEYMRLHALKGIVLDADGSTLYNLFTEFDVSQPSEINFDLNNANPSKGALRKVCHALIRQIEDELGAATYSHIHGLVSAQFLDELIEHPEFIEAHSFEKTQSLLQQQLARRTVEYAGIIFEEYRGKVGATSFVADNKAHFFPVGVPGLFETIFAPADFLETVNTIGLPRYAKIGQPDPMGRSVPIHVQSNPLCLCTRPKVLVQGRVQ
jgi:hypothetical protein